MYSFTSLGGTAWSQLWCNQRNFVSLASFNVPIHIHQFRFGLALAVVKIRIAIPSGMFEFTTYPSIGSKPAGQRGVEIACVSIGNLFAEAIGAS